MVTRTASIRPAVSVERDATAYAVLAEQATHGMFRLLFGPAAHRYLTSAFMKPGHDQSYERVLIAEVDGDIAGMALVYTAEEHARDVGITKEVVATTAWYVLPRVLVVYLAGRRMFSFMDELDPGDMYLQAIAVDPAHRSTGIGSVLLEAIVDRARASGAKRLVLDVDTSNERAIALYGRTGWMIKETSPPTSRLLGSRRVHRMVKPVDTS